MAKETKYTPQMRKAVQALATRKPYRGLYYGIVEYPNMLTIRVWENNIMSFSVDQRVNIMEWLETMRAAIKMFGVDCELEGRPGDPPPRQPK